MAIFGFKKRKDEKLDQAAQASKGAEKQDARKDKISGGPKSVRVAGAPKKAKIAKSVPILTSESASNTASAILRPRITEKSGILSQSGVYTFEISRNANKDTVRKAVKAIYKVIPVKVSIINTSERHVFVKGRHGTVTGFRKALVTVKKGDKIDFV